MKEEAAMYTVPSSSCIYAFEADIAPEAAFPREVVGDPV